MSYVGVPARGSNAANHHSPSVFDRDRALQETLATLERTRAETAKLSTQWKVQNKKNQSTRSQAKVVQAQLQQTLRRSAEEMYLYQQKLGSMSNELSTAVAECKRLEKVIMNLEYQCSDMSYQNANQTRQIEELHRDRDDLVDSLQRYIETVKDEQVRLSRAAAEMDDELYHLEADNAVMVRALQQYEGDDDHRHRTHSQSAEEDPNRVLEQYLPRESRSPTGGAVGQGYQSTSKALHSGYSYPLRQQGLDFNSSLQQHTAFDHGSSKSPSWIEVDTRNPRAQQDSASHRPSHWL